MSFAKTAPNELIVGGVRYVRGDLHDLALAAVRIRSHDDQGQVAAQSGDGQTSRPSLNDLKRTLRRLAVEHKTFRPDTRLELNAAADLIDQQAQDLAREANSRFVLLSMIHRLQAGSSIERVIVESFDERTLRDSLE